MMRWSGLGASLVVASLLAFLPANSSQAAPFFVPGMEAPSLVENVACRVVRERIVRPGGRVIYTSRRICTPTVCRTFRERVVTPGGRVVYRTIRRCR